MHQALRAALLGSLLTASASLAQPPGMPPGGMPRGPMGPMVQTGKRVSPHETISVNVNGKVIQIAYGRPYTKSQPGRNGEPARDRKVWALDDFVPSPWRLGADEATTLVTPAALAFGSVTLPAGTYTLYMNYSDSSAELVFSKNVGKWGIPVDTTSDVAKVPLERSTLTPANDQLVLAFEAGAGAADPIALKIMWDNRQYTARFTVR